MLNEKAHLLLLLSLNKGNIYGERICVESEYFKYKKVLTIEDIKHLCIWYKDEDTKEGIVAQFVGEILDWNKKNNMELNISNLYKSYLEKYQISGDERKHQLFFKFYSKNKIDITEGEMRGEYGRRWIYYEKQLGIADVISDDTGIWVFPDDVLHEMICNQNVRDHYGNNIMVLKMIHDEKYYNNHNLEYIGRSYKVIYRQKLCSVFDYEKFKEYLSKIMLNKGKLSIDRIEYIVNRINCWKDCGCIDINNINLDKLRI